MLSFQLSIYQRKTCSRQPSQRREWFHKICGNNHLEICIYNHSSLYCYKKNIYIIMTSVICTQNILNYLFDIYETLSFHCSLLFSPNNIFIFILCMSTFSDNCLFYYFCHNPSQQSMSNFGLWVTFFFYVGKTLYQPAST